MQVVWREFAAMGLHFFGGWRAGHMAEVQAGLFQGFGPFAQVAGRTGGNDVFPRSDATARAGKNVIEGEVALGGAILAATGDTTRRIQFRGRMLRRPPSQHTPQGQGARSDFDRNSGYAARPSS